MIQLDGMVIDSFAGGGGAGLGIAWALGRSADLAINHDAAAIAMYQANHPDTRTMTEDVWKIDPRGTIGRRKVALLWASPDCKDFSRAKGDKPVSKNTRSLAWVVIKWADQVRPRVIILENVREFEGWGPVVPAWTCAACGWKGTEGQAVLKRQRRLVAAHLVRFNHDDAGARRAGSLRTPESAARLRKESERLDLKMRANSTKWYLHEKDETRGRPLPDHIEAAIEGGKAK